MTPVRIHATSAAPILDVAQIRQLEQQMSAPPGEPLMTRAGQAIARLARAVAPHARRIWIACGPGNNGGDGLEAAIHLRRAGLEVRVSLLASYADLPPDAQRAHQRAQACDVRMEAGMPTSWLETLAPDDLAIDALLGLGVSSPPRGAILQAIERLNALPAQVLAVDLPSGLMPDTGMADPARCVRASHTLSLIALKPGLLMAHGRDACGEIWLDTLDCPIPPEGGMAELNRPQQLAPRPHMNHKGLHGDVAVIGGDQGMRGASLLAAQAALHAGSGRVFWCPLASEGGSLAAPPDLMQGDASRLALEKLSVACGCGGGSAIREVLPAVLRRSAALVLDADALNAVAADPWLQTLLTQRSSRSTVLTPHPLEAARLLDGSVSEIQADRPKAAQALASRFAGSVVVLKGSGTIVATQGQRQRINMTGNARLAIGGTGDVLAGLIAARMNHLPDAFSAACTAVWEHGEAADRWPVHETLTAQALALRLQAPARA